MIFVDTSAENFRSQVADRLRAFQDGRAIVLDGDEQLAQFLDAIDAEVDAELQADTRRDA
jgi:hypothetical protein